MMIFLAIVAVCLAIISGVLAFKLGGARKRNETLSSYVTAVEDERNCYRRDLGDIVLQNQVLIAKLEQIDKVLTRIGADSIRARIQPFLLSAGNKNGSR